MCAALLPVLAVVAFASLGGVAQAAPHWYKCEHFTTKTHKFTDSSCSVTNAKTEGEYELTRLPFEKEGKLTKLRVKTFGVLTLTDGTIIVICFVDDHGKIWNKALAEPGFDEIQVFENYECESSACSGTISIAAEKLPWLTELIAGPPIKDKITGIQIKLSCSSPAFSETFTGTLEPEWVNGTQANGGTSYTEFVAASGKLKGAVSGEATVSGKDYVIGVEHAEQIKIENP